MTTWLERLEELEPYFPMKARRRDATDDDFVRLEAAVGGALPADYRAFVQECGGVGLVDAVVVLEDGGARRGVETFLGFGEAKYGFDLHAKLDRYGDRFPAGVLPIAVDPGGSMFGLVVAGDEVGAVLLYAHDDPRDVVSGPDWLRARVDAELARRGRAGNADDFEERWNEQRHAIPQWACLWRAAASFDAFITSLTR